MRCPSCGASNPESASWCLQCFTAFEPEESETPGSGGDGADGDGGAAEIGEAVAAATRGEPAGAAPGEAAGGSGDGASAEAAELAEAAAEAETEARLTQDDRFRRTEEGIDWSCAVCETWNPIERTSCVACSAAFTQTLGVEEDDEDVEVEETTALLLTALLPGAGHWMIGRRGAGASRALIYVVWLIGGFLLLRGAVQSSQSVLPALPLLLGALIVWGTTQYDTLLALRGGGHGRELLQPRVFLWLVVAVIGALILTFVTATMSLPATET